MKLGQCLCFSVHFGVTPCVLYSVRGRGPSYCRSFSNCEFGFHTTSQYSGIVNTHLVNTYSIGNIYLVKNILVL